MILVDTSVWVGHLRSGNKMLADLLDAGRVLTHPFVIGELALGHLRQRAVILATLSDLPLAGVATDTEILQFMSGTRYLDSASAMSMPICSLRFG